MKIQQFLDHHGIASNPFADEDAQTDLVFKGACIRTTYHPSWDKIYGDPTEPATAVVFGEKGSGKTALRLQIVRHLTDYNADHPEHQVFVVQYDDFNAFLDRFRDRFSRRRRRMDRALEQWRLWDHMDAILSPGRHAIGRSDSGSKAGPASGRPRRSPAHRHARCGASPRRDAAGGLLRPIDGRKPPAALAPPARKIAISHLAIEMGHGLGHRRHRGGRSFFRLVKGLELVWLEYGPT